MSSRDVGVFLSLRGAVLEPLIRARLDVSDDRTVREWVQAQLDRMRVPAHQRAHVQVDIRDPQGRVSLRVAQGTSFFDRRTGRPRR